MKFTRVLLSVVVCCVVCPVSAFAELTNVRVTSRALVADGQAFGSIGPYEQLIGRIEFALDPADPRNKSIVDLAYAPRAADGRVHFESDFCVLRPVDVARGNGVMLFEIANRGNKLLLSVFNDAPAAADPTTPAHFGNGFLMREGYTLVWIGWEFDVAPALLKVDAPLVTDAATPSAGPLQVQFILNQRQEGAVLTDAPLYPPADPGDASATLTVRDRFGDSPRLIPGDTWRFAASTGAPRLEIREGGFEPGRLHEVTYCATGRRVAGVGFAAIRDAASAFRSRSDLPVAGRTAYVFGVSQSGRFLRDFLRDGFNADERGRRVFDAVWPHVAGAAGGSFNEPFAKPTSASAFVSTRPPFIDPLGQYTGAQQPKIFYTNTSVEYWGQGRAAALAHTSAGKDARLPDNVRMYLLSGTQHVQSPFPPSKTTTQQLGNPVPQREVMRALLRGLDDWVRRGGRPPDSRYPRVGDGTLVPVADLRFPQLPGVGDPKTVSGPAQVVQGRVVPFPFLVPQVDADGNEVGGIRVPDLSVPLATTTGWNFRAERVGNPGELLPLWGSYIPFAATRAERQLGDPRPSIAERYAGRDEYLQRIRAAATDLVKRRYLLEEDMDLVLARARAHWDYATTKR
jgi:Alpha/beta hydrolase domain